MRVVNHYQFLCLIGTIMLMVAFFTSITHDNLQYYQVSSISALMGIGGLVLAVGMALAIMDWIHD